MAHLVSLDGRQSPVTEFLNTHTILTESDPTFEPTRTLFKKFESEVLTKQKADSDSSLSSASDRIRNSLEQQYEDRFRSIAEENDAQIDGLKGRVESLEATNHQLKGSNAALEKNVKELTQTLAQQQEEHARALAQASKNYTKELESLRHENTGLSRDLNAAEARKASFAQNIETLQEQLASTKASTEALKAYEQDGKAKLIQEHKAALASSSLQNSELQGQVRDLQEESFVLNDQIRHLQAQLIQTQKELEEAKLDLEEAKNLTTADRIKAYIPTVLASVVTALGVTAALL
jgi:chromosome segregation ATPase